MHPKINSDYLGASVLSAGAKKKRMKTETTGNKQPIANHFQKDRPILLAKNAVISGILNKQTPMNRRKGMM
jgi:hypothetical protein